MSLLNHMFKRLGIMSFKGRLRFWLIALTGMIVVFVSIPLLTLGKQQQVNIAATSIDDTINLQQVVVDGWIEDKLSDIKAIAELPAMRDKNTPMMQEIIASFYRNHPEFNGIVYVNEDGMTEIDPSGPSGIDLSDREYFEQAKREKCF